MGVSKTGMQYLTKDLTDQEMYEKTQDFLVVQWLRLTLLLRGYVGSIPSWKTKSSHAIQ